MVQLGICQDTALSCSAIPTAFSLSSHPNHHAYVSKKLASPDTNASLIPWWQIWFEMSAWFLARWCFWLCCTRLKVCKEWASQKNRCRRKSRRQFAVGSLLSELQVCMHGHFYFFGILACLHFILKQTFAATSV